MLENKINEIILIDDDKVLNLMNNRLIRNCGFTCEITSLNNGAEAIRYLYQKHGSFKFTFVEELPSLILLDLNMPIMSGWEFIEAFRTFDEGFKRRFKIVILTSSYNPDDMEMAKKYEEVLGLENKPLSGEGLLSLLNQYF